MEWHWLADYLQTCNCDYGCPCNFDAPPSPGFCEGTGVWHIRVGNLESVKLDGLNCGFAAHWPKAIHLGGGTLAAYIDERANVAQRDAFLKIMTGQAGGLPFSILATTFSKVLDPVFVPFEVDVRGEHSSFKMGNAAKSVMEAITNPVTKEPHFADVEMPTGFIFTKGAVYSNKECWVKDRDLNFSHPNKNAHLAIVNYSHG